MVTVTASVTGEAAAPTVALYWSASGVAQIESMHDDGAHGDGIAGDGYYGATITGLSSGTVVTYFVQANDAAGLVSTDPPRAPDVVHHYTVGFRRPALHLNEFIEEYYHPLRPHQSLAARSVTDSVPQRSEAWALA